MTTFTKIEDEAPRTLRTADLKPRGRVFPSPATWRDQLFYQLLPDRFSDGREATRPMFDPAQPEQFKAGDKAAWMAAGNRFVGGTLKGIQSKLDYLQGLGVTTLWINPPWRQRAGSADLSRLRHPELPRHRSALWHAPGSAATWWMPPTIAGCT